MADVLKCASNYDYVERNYGFFKYQQENLHKSNIYSIKIENSGLNPDTDEKLTYFTKKEVISKLCVGNSDPLSNKLFEGNILKTDAYYNQNTDEFFILSNTNKFNAKLDVELLRSKKFTFDEFLEMNNWKTDIIDDIQVYYHLSDKERISKISKTKADMRKILEDAIKNSVTKYMPANTNLWKIIYSGK